ncbi:hypothetical protein B0H13DRAFT_1904777 [Mycena leptocephala]|nr:hypothetical protein B0H13DRAFT_1904777 [Mycena leptocephala]
MRRNCRPKLIISVQEKVRLKLNISVRLKFGRRTSGGSSADRLQTIRRSSADSLPLMCRRSAAHVQTVAFDRSLSSKALTSLERQQSLSGRSLWLHPQWRQPSAHEQQTVCRRAAARLWTSSGSSADERRTIRRSSADQISAALKRIVSGCISVPAEMQTEIYHFNCTEMRYETRDFGVHFGKPEILSFSRTFFYSETPSFGVQFQRNFFSIRLLGFRLRFSVWLIIEELGCRPGMGDQPRGWKMVGETKEDDLWLLLSRQNDLIMGTCVDMAFASRRKRKNGCRYQYRDRSAARCAHTCPGPVKRMHFDGLRPHRDTRFSVRENSAERSACFRKHPHWVRVRGHPMNEARPKEKARASGPRPCGANRQHPKLKNEANPKRELGAAERNTTQYKKNTALDKKRATDAQRRNESNKTPPTHPNTHPKKADIEDARTAIWLKYRSRRARRGVKRGGEGGGGVSLERRGKDKSEGLERRDKGGGREGGTKEGRRKREAGWRERGGRETRKEEGKGWKRSSGTAYGSTCLEVQLCRRDELGTHNSCRQALRGRGKREGEVRAQEGVEEVRWEGEERGRRSTRSAEAGLTGQRSHMLTSSTLGIEDLGLRTKDSLGQQGRRGRWRVEGWVNWSCCQCRREGTARPGGVRGQRADLVPSAPRVRKQLKSKKIIPSCACDSE